MLLAVIRMQLEFKVCKDLFLLLFNGKCMKPLTACFKS